MKADDYQHAATDLAPVSGSSVDMESTSARKLTVCFSHATAKHTCPWAT